ncbi:hypothetical protein [Streptomyces sp. GS7]|uniref:hypothetical protein n=1 Tax=Streptomyces sp. GS7 TaxID=2692234 RepID=UPI001315F8E7|nr:hypothetical protein [Streptomyces sp. GS7]QHC25730.1 hypothetical protein GR130_34425 [Streptomyces sp. GS7]
MRDEQLPLTRRHTALRCAVGHYCPLGFNATWAYLTATARPSPDLRRDPAALLRALQTLEDSRTLRLNEIDAIATRRHAEKAAGRRTPRPTDTTQLRGPHWPSETAPSRLGLVAAVADRHTDFRRLPYPDETLYRDSEAPQLAGLHSHLDAYATTYLTNLGHVEAPTRDSLAQTIRAIERLVRPSCTPLNGYLLMWLRFAHLVAYAAAAPYGHGALPTAGSVGRASS